MFSGFTKKTRINDNLFTCFFGFIDNSCIFDISEFQKNRIKTIIKYAFFLQK